MTRFARSAPSIRNGAGADCCMFSLRTGLRDCPSGLEPRVFHSEEKPCFPLYPIPGINLAGGETEDFSRNEIPWCRIKAEDRKAKEIKKYSGVPKECFRPQSSFLPGSKSRIPPSACHKRLVPTGVLNLFSPKIMIGFKHDIVMTPDCLVFPRSAMLTLLEGFHHAGSLCIVLPYFFSYRLPPRTILLFQNKNSSQKLPASISRYRIFLPSSLNFYAEIHFRKEAKKKIRFCRTLFRDNPLS